MSVADPSEPASSEYFRSPDAVSRYSGRSELLAAERAILEHLRPSLAGAALLDIGVGGGRTTIHFAPLVERYVGVDYNPGMIDECRRRFAGDRAAWTTRAELATRDARNLADYDSASFDVVWFSYNGLDLVGGRADRELALREMLRVCRPGGAIVFSSHNFNSIHRLPRARAGLRRPLAWRAALLTRRALLADNPQLRSARGASEAMVRETRPAGQTVTWFYITPEAQTRELRAAGLHRVVAVSEQGQVVADPAGLGSLVEAFTHYWAVKPS